jgi:hypothetical protein
MLKWVLQTSENINPLSLDSFSRVATNVLFVVEEFESELLEIFV